MDFLDPHKQRKHRITLYIGYVLMAILVLTGTFILVLAANGYDIDRRTGSVIQNGLLFVGAHPQTAEIYINDQSKGTTDGRYVLEEGQYNIVLRREGYRNWTHDLRLEGSSVERLVYPFLFPASPQTSDVQLYADRPVLASQSPDRRWIVIVQQGNLSSVEVIDANDKNNPSKIVALPAGVLSDSGEARTIEAVEWSTDNRHLLLKHTFGAAAEEYILFDRADPAASQNLTKALGAAYPDLQLRDKKHDLYYSLDAAGVLRAINLADKQAEIVAQGVIGYTPYQADTLLYTSEAGATDEGSVAAHMRRGSDDYILRDLPKSSTYLMDMASFGGDDYVVIGADADSRAYVYKNPLHALARAETRTLRTKAWLKVSEPAMAVSFSANARFIALQGAGWFAVYDIENNRQFRYDTGLKPENGSKARWMDGHRLVVNNQDGKLYIFDFDGTNKQELVPIAPGTRAFFDRDYTALFTVAPSAVVPDRSALTRTELIVELES